MSSNHRSRSWLRCPWAAALAAICSLGTLVQAEVYEIKIDRPLTVGHRVNVLAKASDAQERAMTLGGRELPSNTVHNAVTLEALEEVGAVDGEGRVKAAQFTIDSVAFRNGDEDQAAFAKGTLVQAVRKGKQTVYSVGGVAVSPEKSRYLEMVVGLAGSDADDGLIQEDQIFGSPKKHQVGDRWMIDKEAFSTYFKTKFSPPFEFAVKEGSVTLEKVAAVLGEVCVHLTAEVKIRIDSLPQIPGEAKFKERDLTLDYTIMLPVDVTLPRMGESFALRSAIDVSTEVNGKATTMKLKVERTYEATFKPLTPAAK